MLGIHSRLRKLRARRQALAAQTGKPVAAFRRVGLSRAQKSLSNLLSVVGPLVILALLLVASRTFGAAEQDPASVAGERRLHSSSGVSCDSDFDDITPLAVIVYLLVLLYAFLGLAIICDEYFVASLEIISDKLNLSEDVAGATFMASASSAPELFSNTMDTFGPSNNIGIGTIVGSAMFNILIIIAAAAVFSSTALKIDWKPLLRDVVFYCCSIAAILVMFLDGDVKWFESAILLFGYVLYVVFMVFNQRAMSALGRCAGEHVEESDDEHEITLELTDIRDEETGKAISGTMVAEKLDVDPVPKITVFTNIHTATQNRLTYKDFTGVSEDTMAAEIAAANTVKELDDAISSGDDDEPGILPEWAESVINVVAWPLKLLFKYSVPDCREEEQEKWYIVTFVMSIVWIGILSYGLVHFASMIGCLLGIPPIIMGVTLLAIGTSIPDALGSIVAARDGLGSMAVSNAIGSNVFDIFVGFGLPWLAKYFIDGESIEVDNDDLLKPILILFGTVVLVIGVMAAQGWRLTHKLGVIFMVMYVLFIIHVILDEYAY